MDWLYPPVCAGCGKSGHRWCEDCAQNIIRPGASTCEICGDNTKNHEKLCHRCNKVPPNFKALRSYADYSGPIRNAIHRMKFRADMGIADIFSRYLIDYYLSLGWDVDMIVPVPLGKRRYADRGYNQTHLLSRPFALYINKHHYNNCLKKIKETRPQVGLNPEERSKNVISAYWADPKTVSGKVILLIDDVTTTGSTINSCSEALLLAGASSVYGLTVARATIKTHTDIM